MAIRVRIFGEMHVFPHARDWYSGEDKTLQIYQDHQDENGNWDPEFVIAEFADGSWEHVMYDPMPVPPQPDDGLADNVAREEMEGVESSE
jgi:hypothetical protein